MKECGICGSTKDLIGPYAGGPIAWYCKRCRKTIDKYQRLHKEFKVFIEEQIKKAGRKMLEFEKIHEDKRGEIYLVTGLFPEGRELTLFTTKKGYARGGCIHKDNDESCCVLSGVIEYYIEGRRPERFSKGRGTLIPKNHQHFFIALTDTIVVEWGATPAEKKQKGKWRKYVDEINERNLK